MVEPRNVPRVALVEADGIFAEALGVALESRQDLVFVGRTSTAAQGMDLLKGRNVDVLLMDLDAAAKHGADAQRQFLLPWPAARLVILADDDHGDRLAEAVRRGARGWVAKRADLNDLLSVIHGVARGETHIPPHLLTDLLETLTADSVAPTRHADTDALGRLSERENEVLDAMAAGKGRQEVGDWLGVSPNTVRTHIQNILRKLNVESAVAAVALARRAAPHRSVPHRSVPHRSVPH